MSINHSQTASLSLIKRFLSWPSGAIATILVRYPSEQNYFCGLGTLVWFNSILAGCGMTLMLSQTSDSVASALGGGIFWFLCIVNLDRFMLLATYENTGWKRLMPVARILLSVGLAIVIGEHVVQYIFHNEINNQLAQEKLAFQRSNYDKALESFPEIPLLNDEKSRKQAEIEKAKEEISRLRTAYISEAEGSAGSGVRGKGPLYDQKQRDYQVALSEKQKRETELQEIQNRLDAKTSELNLTVKAANNAKDKDRGFLAYHRALFEIIRHDITLLFLYFVISAVMILFEITPLFSKLGGKTRLYDFLLGQEMTINQQEQEQHYTNRLQNFQTESEAAASLAKQVSQLQRNILEEVTKAVQNNTCSNLHPDKQAIAESLKAQVYGSLKSQVGQKDVDGQEKNTVESFASVPDTNNPASVTVLIKNNEEQSFTIVFRHPRGQVRGGDLLYSLAGLEQAQPASLQQQIPLHEYQVTNGHGELIQSDALLFPQISGDNMVYLVRVEPTVN